MSTRSYIALYNEKDQSVDMIYCHFDGYPEGVGQILARHYGRADKVRELINLGNISSLAPRLAPEPGEVHDFTNRADGVTVAYIRDRGDSKKINAPMHFKSFWHAQRYFFESDCDFFYYFGGPYNPDIWEFVERPNARHLWTYLRSIGCV